MSIGSKFYNDRVHSLRQAVNTLGSDNEFIFQQGLQILEARRSNYGPDGPPALGYTVVGMAQRPLG